MMSKLGHLVFVYIGSYFLCLDVPFHIKTLKIRLDWLLQVKITFFMKIGLWVDTYWRIFEIKPLPLMYRYISICGSIHNSYGLTHPGLESTPTEGFTSQMALPCLYRLQGSMYRLLGSMY